LFVDDAPGRHHHAVRPRGYDYSVDAVDPKGMEKWRADYRNMDPSQQVLIRLQRQFADVGVEVAYLSYTQTTSSSRLRLTLQNIDDLAKGHVPGTPFVRLAA
jgi:hypothetical protein